MRGKVTFASALHKGHRITPRVCGEKQKKSPTGLVTRGSPPHVRGKGLYCVSNTRYTGITPACAGKRNSNAEVTQAYEDHPRMCGEKQN